MLGSLLAITQIISYPTIGWSDAGGLGMLGTYVLVVVALATMALPDFEIPPALAVALGVLLCCSALIFVLANPSLLSRPIGVVAIAPFGLTGLASFALGAAFGRFDRRRNGPASLPAAWWRLLALVLAIVGAVGLGLFLLVILNAGSFLVFGATISWSVALIAALRSARRA